MSNRDTKADLIMIGAVLTSMPRWIGSLLQAEGLIIPPSLEPLWVALSIILNGAMAVVEGFAFAYILEAWRNQKDKRASRLVFFALLAALTFIIVQAPYVGSRVTSQSMDIVLGNRGVFFWLWAIAVPLSTISIVGAVGYAQKATKSTSPAPRPRQPAKSEPKKAQRTCFCGATHTKSGRPFMTQHQIAAHIRAHALEVKDMTFEQAWDHLTSTYPPSERTNGAEPFPTKERVKQWTKS